MSSFVLKIIALVSMIIDHAGKFALPPSIIGPMLYGPGGAFPPLAHWIGRMAFPIYCYLIAEGCRKTRSMPKFIGRLALFAVISHIVFYIVVHTYVMDSMFLSAGEALDALLSLRIDNVFTTLALGASSSYVFALTRRRKPALLVPVSAAALFLCMGAAEYCGSDYGALGVLLIFCLYIVNERKTQLAVLFTWCCLFYLGVATGWTPARLASVNTWIQWGAACLCLIPAALYNGRRGTGLKWAFYIAYPAHLAAIVAIHEALLPWYQQFRP